MKNFTKGLFLKMGIGFFIALFMSLSINVNSQETTPILRFPDIHENQVVFTAEEDLWIASTDGGEAHRLTIHDGEETTPKFSPDGRRIAFTAEYDGNKDVYVMNNKGGNITRLTYHSSYDEVLGWHPARNKIMFRSTRQLESGIETQRIFLISPGGGFPKPLNLIEAARGSFSPEGNRIAFNKTSRSGRTWKRYEGGRAQQVYLYDLETDEEKQLTDFEGTDRFPMWIGDRIYFTSDRDGHLNLYSIGAEGENIRQLTDHDTFDARFPGAGKEKIVYEHGGDIFAYDLQSGETGKIDITISTDAVSARPRIINVDKNITGIGISPNGKRALVEARGEIFTVPRQHGPIYNLTESSGARDKDPAWSPNGEKIAYLSDQSGEYEIHIIDKKGADKLVQLTDFGKGYRHTLRWSPDGSKIAFTDQTLTLYYLDVESEKITIVDKAHFESVDVPIDEKPIYDFKWSPDSRFLTYSKMTEDQIFQVFIYSLEEGKAYNVSQNTFNDFHPVFTNDGNHLLLVSNSHFDPTFGDFEWEMVYKDVAGIYALTLEKDSQPFLPLQNDELDGDQKEKSAGNRVDIDFEGIANRVEALPLKKGNFRYLSVNDNKLFYLNKADGDFNRFEFRDVKSMDLHAFDFSSRSSYKVLGSVNEYKLSNDGSSIVYKKGKKVGIIPASDKDSKGQNLDLSNLKMKLHPRKEWNQIYDEAWRMERDFYYEPDMHGINWKQMKEKYAGMMERASCRSDVDYIIGELIGELNTSHTYVAGGDEKRDAENVSVGMLGADYRIDESTKRYQFDKILRASAWARSVEAPLNKPGLNLEEGDYLLAVNDKQVTAEKNIYSYFVDKAGEQVTLTVNDAPSMEGSRKVVAKPVAGERTLRYINWVERNRKKVEQVSDGKIGYIHFPDTYMGSATFFPRYFYSQLRKDGIIVDGRFNSGGLDPYVFLRRLNTKPLAYWTRRYSHDQTIPPTTTQAEMICITNKYAGSGGDMLPYEFRKMDMGKIIGTTTWGGLVGVSQFIPMIDGGMLTAPDYRIYDTHGDWIIENEGVTPDIRIELDSKRMTEGYDTQLMKAVELLQQQIDEKSKDWPEHEEFLDDETAE